MVLSLPLLPCKDITFPKPWVGFPAQKKSHHLRSREQPSPDTKSTGALILDFTVSRTVRKYILFFANYPDSGILL
jgi:hypothetical protein